MSAEGGDLWDWAVATYGRPGVKDALLTLQNERGVDVSLLLWRLWLAARDCAVAPDVEARAVALSEAWRNGVVAPLRAARTAAKAPPEDVDRDAATALRERILALELDAERLQLAALEVLSRDATSLGDAAPDLAGALAAFPPLEAIPAAEISPLIRALTHR